MTMRLLRSFLLLCLLGGCAAIASVSSASRPLDTYELRPLPPSASVARGTRHLIVEPPTASGALSTDRIAIKPNAFEVSYLPGVRWSDAAPDLLQLLMARSIEGAGGFALVSTGTGQADSDWHLETDLQAFQLELAPEGAARATVRVRATLVSDADRRVRGARTFAASALAEGTDVEVAIPAFDQATEAVLRELTAWTVASAR